MYTRDLGQPAAGEGLHKMEAQFLTEHLVIHAEVTSAETRMSDYLNGSSRSVEVQPIDVRLLTGSGRDLSNTMAHLTKAQLMFVIPLMEPEVRERDSSSWSWYLKYRCWAAMGHYHVVGNVHAENYRDPRLLLRALEQRQFLPFSDAELTYPDGRVVTYPAVIVNRWHLEVLSVPKPRW
jgi:hypothetical protein